MKRVKLQIFKTAITVLCILIASAANAKEIDGILERTYSQSGVAESFKTGGNWYPYPAYQDRKAWDKLLPDDLKKSYIKAAEKKLKYQWQHIPASTFLALNTTGDKQEMRKIESANRKAIIALMLGELAEGKGRFLENLADGFWFYATSFHWSHSNQTYGQLPKYENEKIALGNVRHGATLPVIYHFFKDEFDKMDPMICETFRATVKRIIMDPFLDETQDEANWWLGFKGNKVNNWNPWCNHGVLLTFLLMEEDQQRLDKAIAKTVRSVDYYLRCYPEDAACDEGAGYWGQSVSRFCEYLQLMKDASDGKFDILPNDFVKSMGEYISSACFAATDEGKYLFVNYADGNMEHSINSMMAWKTGKMFGSREMTDFALYGLRDIKRNKFSYPKTTSDEGYRQMENIRAYKDICLNVDKLNDRLKGGSSMEDLMKELRSSVGQCTWYPVTQQAFIHTKDSWFIGAKAGNNGETHGHNDVGSFILSHSNIPFLVDPGVGVYVKDTFGANRYTIWSMQSNWHNCPKPNGVEQMNGADYKAENVNFSSEKKAHVFTANLAKAYTEDAKCESWIRTITINDSASGSTVEIRDDFKLAERTGADIENFITPGNIKVEGNHAVIEYKGQSISLEWSENLTAHVEVKNDMDNRIGKQWDNVLYRLSLKSADDAPTSGTYTIKIKR